MKKSVQEAFYNFALGFLNTCDGYFPIYNIWQYNVRRPKDAVLYFRQSTEVHNRGEQKLPKQKLKKKIAHKEAAQISIFTPCTEHTSQRIKDLDINL